MLLWHSTSTWCWFHQHCQHAVPCLISHFKHPPRVLKQLPPQHNAVISPTHKCHCTYLFRWLYAHVAVRNNQCNMWMWYLHCTHAVCMWLLTYWYMIMSVVIVALLWEKMLPLRMPWLEFSVGALVYYPLYALCTAVEYKYITWLFCFAGWISVSSSGQIVAKWLQLAVCE